MGRKEPMPCNSVLVVNDATVAVDEINIWVLVEVFGNKVQSSRRQQIVAIQVGEDVARSPIEPACDGVSLAGVWAGMEVMKVSNVRLQHFESVVGRAAVPYN